MTSDRWKADAGTALLTEVLDRLQRGKSLEGLGLGSRGHRLDLTELPASPVRASKPVRLGTLAIEQMKGQIELRRRTLSRIDFSDARLNGWRLRNSELLDCRFDRARCAEWVLWHTSVLDCDFQGADLRNSLLGTYPEGGHVRWERVSFVGADLRASSAYGSVFVECDFSNARLNEMNFHQCAFVRCTFAGIVEEVLFDGRDLPDRAAAAEMESADFENAHFVSVDFRGYSLRSTRLPRDPDVFPIRRFPCVARRVTDSLAHETSESARIVRGMIQNAMPWTESRPDSVWVFNRRDWHEWGGPDVAVLAERLMRQAEADCT